MKKITTAKGVFGAYESIEVLDDRYIVDGGAQLPFSVIGIGEISDVSEGDFPAPEIKSQVPCEISPRQLRQALSLMGLRAAVEAYIDTSDLTMKDWYQFSVTFSRNHGLVSAAGQELGVSDSVLDQIWILGNTL